MPLKTERLILRKLEETDVERMFLLDSNADVMKYVGAAPLSELHQSQEVIKLIQKQYLETGLGRLAVIEKSTGLLIGWSGLKLLTKETNGYKNIYELGYRFLPESWGKGFATEAAEAVLEYGFHGLKALIIYAYAHCENKASHRILTKL